ncbi:hypothetical protein [Streptomyces sp. NPDC005093]
MTHARPVQGYGTQIKSAAQYVRDCRELYKNALQTRNKLIVDAVDHGYSGHQAARDAEVKQPHIIRILSCSQPDLTIE